MTERQLQDAVVELARLLGWRLFHTFDSRKSEAGFPDLCLVRRGRLIFAELKTEVGVASQSQTAWLEDLSRTPAEVFIWRPEHWTSGEIERRLR